MLIVDTGADLNVYLETGDDGNKKEGCCAPGAAATAATGGSAGSSGCSIPASVKTDLNEFVGALSGPRTVACWLDWGMLTSGSPLPQARTKSLP